MDYAEFVNLSMQYGATMDQNGSLVQTPASMTMMLNEHQLDRNSILSHSRIMVDMEGPRHFNHFISDDNF